LTQWFGEVGHTENLHNLFPFEPNAILSGKLCFSMFFDKEVYFSDYYMVLTITFKTILKKIVHWKHIN